MFNSEFIKLVIVHYIVIQKLNIKMVNYIMTKQVESLVHPNHMIVETLHGHVNSEYVFVSVVI